MAGGGIVADEQFRAGDFGGEGCEGSIVGSHARLDGAFDAFAFRGAAAFVDQNGRAGRRQQPQQLALEIVIKTFGGIFADAEADRDVERRAAGRARRNIRPRLRIVRPARCEIGQPLVSIAPE